MVITVVDAGPLQQGNSYSKQYQIWSGSIKLGASYGIIPGTSASSSKLNTAVGWTSGSLQTATLTVTTSQDYDSVNILGSVELVTFMNGQQVLSQKWGIYDTGTKTNTIDITSEIQNGVDSFQFTYNVPDSVLPGESALCNVSAYITLTATTPPSPPSPSLWNVIEAFFTSDAGIAVIVAIVILSGLLGFVAVRRKKKG